MPGRTFPLEDPQCNRKLHLHLKSPHLLCNCNQRRTLIITKFMYKFPSPEVQGSRNTVQYSYTSADMVVRNNSFIAEGISGEKFLKTFLCTNKLIYTAFEQIMHCSMRK